MKDEEPTLKNIATEFSTPGYWKRAQERKRASKTVWDLIFLPIGFAAIGGYAYAFAKFFLWIHFIIYPADVARTKVLMGGSMNLGQALMFVLPLFPSIPLGLMTGNALMWLVPPARRASEKAAEGIKWASFRDSQLGLFKVALVLVPIGLIGGVIGALILEH